MLFVFCQVCRVLRGYLSWAISYASSESTGIPHENDWKDPKTYLKEAHLRIQEALGNCLLPSLQLLPANPAIGLEIWEVMSLLPYEVAICVKVIFSLHGFLFQNEICYQMKLER